MSKPPLRVKTPTCGRELAAKQAYFDEQALLALSDDERDFSDRGESVVSQALDDSMSMVPPRLARQGSSFLGPTPKERQAEFEAHTIKQRSTTRTKDHSPNKAFNAPEVNLKCSKSGPDAEILRGSTLKRVSSLPNVTVTNAIPFYKRMGKIPRELKNGKNVKSAESIVLEPESKQLLKNKIVYFYPDDDISMQRRTRIHKVIQLGAAWVDRWREDVTHIILDSVSYTYSQLLRHLNRAGFSVGFSASISTCIH